MQQRDREYITLLLLQYLSEESDAGSPISLVQMQSFLSEHGISADRRPLYRTLDAMEKAGYPLVRVHKNNAYTYYLDHRFSLGEAFVLVDAIRSSSALTTEDKQAFYEKLRDLLSHRERDMLPIVTSVKEKTENRQVLATIGLLINAIASYHLVSFHYYDLTPGKEKKMRRDGAVYTMMPVWLYANDGRYYAVFWSDKYQGLSSYRIDKMDDARMMDAIHDPVRFDPEEWMRKTFHAYTGDADTITAVFDNRMAQQLFDQFGMDIIISHRDQDHFTASIPAAITPTLTAWLLQFGDQVHVLEPQSLIDSMIAIADGIQKNYNSKQEAEHERSRKD